MSKTIPLSAAIAAAGALALAACGGSSNNSSAPKAVNPGNGTGPAATLACKSSGQNAFTTYGAPAFVAVNEQIFTNVFAELKANGNTNLGGAFGLIGSGNPPATIDSAATFKGNLAAFLVYVYGGPSKITYTDGVTYAGPQDMGQAHAGLNITSSQYDYFVSSIIVPALTAKGVPMGDVSSCFAPPLVDPAFKAKIVNNAAGTGLGTSLKCASNGTKNAFDTYGASAFVAVNEQIFTNVGAEISAHGTANLGDAFTKIGSGNPPSTKDNLAAFKGNLAAFLVFTFGGPSQITYTDNNVYYGPQDMAQSHMGLNITSAQFDYFVSSIVVPALTAKGVPMNDISSCFAPPLVDPNFKALIVGQ